MMTAAREIAYRVDPVPWAIHVLGTTPHEWQKEFLRVSRGKEIKVLTSRQVGKTTAAAIGMAHTAVFMPGSLSVVACPSQRQSAEAIRKVRGRVMPEELRERGLGVALHEAARRSRRHDRDHGRGGQRLLAVEDAE